MAATRGRGQDRRPAPAPLGVRAGAARFEAGAGELGAGVDAVGCDPVRGTRPLSAVSGGRVVLAWLEECSRPGRPGGVAPSQAVTCRVVWARPRPLSPRAAELRERLCWRIVVEDAAASSSGRAHGSYNGSEHFSVAGAGLPPSRPRGRRICTQRPGVPYRCPSRRWLRFRPWPRHEIF